MTGFGNKDVVRCMTHDKTDGWMGRETGKGADTIVIRLSERYQQFKGFP